MWEVMLPRAAKGVTEIQNGSFCRHRLLCDFCGNSSQKKSKGHREAREIYVWLYEIMVRTKKELKINWSFSVQGYIFRQTAQSKTCKSCTHSLLVDRGPLKQNSSEKRLRRTRAKGPLAGAYPGFLSMMHALGVLLLLLDGILDHCLVTPEQYVAGTPLYTWVKRDKVE